MSTKLVLHQHLCRWTSLRFQSCCLGWCKHGSRRTRDVSEKKNRIILTVKLHDWNTRESLFNHKKDKPKMIGASVFYLLRKVQRSLWQREAENITSWWTHFLCVNNTSIRSARISMSKFKISILLLRKMQCWISPHKTCDREKSNLLDHREIITWWRLLFSFVNATQFSSLLFLMKHIIKTEKRFECDFFFWWSRCNVASGKEKQKS